jgi:hypothetical protein
MGWPWRKTACHGNRTACVYSPLRTSAQLGHVLHKYVQVSEGALRFSGTITGPCQNLFAPRTPLADLRALDQVLAGIAGWVVGR